MAKNPYQVLGVASTATDSEIRTAFRTLAKKFHPDRNPGDLAAEDRFKEVSAAFDILGDADKRKRFDRGEIDAEGRERGAGPYGAGRPGGAYGGAAGGAGGYGGAQSGASFEDLGDIFADLFGGRRTSAARGRDLRYRLEVDFLDAVRGAKKRVTMPDGRRLEIAIPAGLEEGQTLRLRGQGQPGAAGGPPGDVYVEATIKPHAYFERRGADIHVEVPISLREAVLGAKITAPTIAGDVTVTVPKYANSGMVLRLKGRGAPGPRGETPGDQYVKLRIVLPDGEDPELEAFVKGWKAGDRQAPRRHFESA